ncbi:MAG: hypothetical protein SFZ23_00220 [Planctomycetota bacterium]|nr:hypothetical protein [Planctomycetota bacterium]
MTTSTPPSDAPAQRSAKPDWRKGFGQRLSYYLTGVAIGVFALVLLQIARRSNPPPVTPPPAQVTNPAPTANVPPPPPPAPPASSPSAAPQ